MARRMGVEFAGSGGFIPQQYGYAPGSCGALHIDKRVAREPYMLSRGDPRHRKRHADRRGIGFIGFRVARADQPIEQRIPA